jgi:hypothetical protein
MDEMTIDDITDVLGNYFNIDEKTLVLCAYEIMGVWAHKKLKAGQHETMVIAPKWETPDEFGLYEIFDDGSYEFLEGELFWGLVEVKNNKTGKTKNEVYLCGINDSGLYAYDPENDVDYYPGWSLEDIQYCMCYEKKGQ